VLHSKFYNGNKFPCNLFMNILEGPIDIKKNPTLFKDLEKALAIGAQVGKST
jgi:poly-beta-hydroxyalkanoate depolymerase